MSENFEALKKLVEDQGAELTAIKDVLGKVKAETTDMLGKLTNATDGLTGEQAFYLRAQLEKNAALLNLVKEEAVATDALVADAPPPPPPPALEETGAVNGDNVTAVTEIVPATTDLVAENTDGRV